ncbi:hypothetical protein DCC85_05620 [Paenibacillus sp. CAA11]|uniref:hypothetical protein n=1 Tax=Paenibacillus sp. CAA11 TaxID=1532905 RepID=UPI000D3947A6|nr:hypothetical protein [Paenibacillus sp. CAA11]AWB43749.1 hypothetical protein DCC85_05620 [Paenibacillus sp. CAA11]
MEQQEYARYLFELIDEEPVTEEIDADHLYGYFQSFMPSGKGVERVFEPLERGTEYLERILPIYGMLDLQDFKGNTVPGYFNGSKKEASQEVLLHYGEQLLAKLLALFTEHGEREYAGEAIAALKEVKDIVIVGEGRLDALYEEHDETIDESLYELIYDHTDDDEAIQILKEAYYSIACDYWVSYYLQWPRYQGVRGQDPLAPYFELYRLGYGTVITQQTLYIGKL